MNKCRNLNWVCLSFGFSV